ncbi:MAG TPA: hypothetical protein VG711_07935 [Phycisphaerales bacterium]|nr:hypothetical protein [Phycisphaerales bacterium]
MKSETLKDVPAHSLGDLVRSYALDGAHKMLLARAKNTSWTITAVFPDSQKANQIGARKNS